MSLCPQSGAYIPEATAQVARAAFPKGNLSLPLRDARAMMYAERVFADLFLRRGPPAAFPGRLTLVAVLPCAANLSDRQAPDAVRSLTGWKYLPGVDHVDPGFDFSSLRACRDRLLAGGRAQRWLDDLLARFRERGLLPARGNPLGTLLGWPIAVGTLRLGMRKAAALPCLHTHRRGGWTDHQALPEHLHLTPVIGLGPRDHRSKGHGPSLTREMPGRPICATIHRAWPYVFAPFFAGFFAPSRRS
jgi:hypothetical protein